MIIALLGYMGSGKSTVGKALARYLDFQFVDLDDYIEQQGNQSISELFKNKGEIKFRAIERSAVETLCRSSNAMVLALGGGTPCYGDTMTFLVNHPNVFTIYLKTSIQSLHNRLSTEQSKRPLIAHLPKDQLTEFIAKHVFERSKFYNRAQLIVNTEHKTIDGLISEISEELN